MLPGELVQCLITAIVTSGINVQMLGYFDGTIDRFHLPVGDLDENLKVGQKVKARVLYEIHGSSPPQFSLSLAEHVLQLGPKSTKSEGDSGPTIQESYPIGTTLDSVKVVRVDSERGLVVEVQPDLQGFIHVRSSLC